MKMKRTNDQTGAGFTLLEMAISLAMLATLSTSSMVLVRTTYSAWNRHEDEHLRQRAAVAVLRHLVRKARQAVAVSAISNASDTSGTVSLLTSSGDLLVWNHDGATNEVRFGTNGATDLLAKNIEEFSLVGIQADGLTPTTDVSLIHSIRCIVKYLSVHPGGTQLKTVSCQAWLRSW